MVKKINLSRFIVKLINKIILSYQNLKLTGDDPVSIYGAFDLVKGEKFSYSNGLSINHNVYINASGGVSLGENVSLSAHCQIISTGLVFKDKKLMNDHYQEEIIIGNNVQIGAGAIVLPGVKICDNVIVAAGAVVSRSIVEPGIYIGVPCRKAS
ncbi:acyltransferase [Vibrio harveyi]|uniref:acyltransferase n=1 Tax=Vibrio harveyi TaxID=669 RepID=UPI0027F422DB|nr:acyltransferase [Vibrio harveyi]ELV8724958.1 acyltransferase [Vibrio harveyi]